jgi:hypothetical protein
MKSIGCRARRASAVAALILAVLCGAGAARTADPPQPPCGAAPFPDYPPLGSPPQTAVWIPGELDAWDPGCAGLSRGAYTVIVALAGRFREEAGADGILARIGAISTLTDTRYWSITDKRWQPLIVKAVALGEPSGVHPRPNFTAGELRAAGDHYFMQSDNRIGTDVVYRLRVAEASGGRIRFSTENVGPVSWLGIPLLAGGGIQSAYFLDRESDGVWNFYSLTRIGPTPPLLSFLVKPESYANRAVALFSHLAGLPAQHEGR